MAITSTGLNAATNPEYTAPVETKDKSVLGKDDFMKLLLVELQYQDPTEPMDSEKILTQTSQLAGLESSENTNKALETLTAALSSTQEFSTISAIGKRADLGSDALLLDQGSSVDFEMYFPEEIANGTINITDLEDNVVATINIEMDEGETSKAAGVYKFTWDGLDTNGNYAESGIYRVNSTYTDTSGTAQTSRIGAYPIESVRFDGGKTYFKLGSSYVPLEEVAEVY